VDKVGPITFYVPSGEVLPIYEAAEKYINEGKFFGSGSSRV
jgi:aconitase A